MPKSYLSDEPAAQRAKMVNFDPVLQIRLRLEQLRRLGHSTDKIELVVIGGTFSAYPREYRLEFFKNLYDACNGCSSDSLEDAQRTNETASHRIVGISIETRPDFITKDEVKFLRYLGVTKIQLGAQAFNDSVLKKIKRGHKVSDIANATRLLRNAGLKICYHFMPNLPGSDPTLDIAMANLIFSDPNFKPDYLKVYPCTVVPGTQLEQSYIRGEYQTYSDLELKELLKKIKKITPPYVRIDRLIRDISRKWVVSGTLVSNMRQSIQSELLSEGTPCRCIRCREIKLRQFSQSPQLIVRNYPTVGGEEYFLSYELEENLFSLLRLRLPESTEELLFPEINRSAIVREVHTFGTVVPLHKTKNKLTQHRGLGKALMAKAEEISRSKGYPRIAVISAVGTRQYYASLGYRLEGDYMIKDLT